MARCKRPDTKSAAVHNKGSQACLHIAHREASNKAHAAEHHGRQRLQQKVGLLAQVIPALWDLQRGGGCLRFSGRVMAWCTGTAGWRQHPSHGATPTNARHLAPNTCLGMRMSGTHGVGQALPQLVHHRGNRGAARLARRRGGGGPELSLEAGALQGLICGLPGKSVVGPARWTCGQQQQQRGEHCHSCAAHRGGGGRGGGGGGGGEWAAERRAVWRAVPISDA